MKVILAAGGTGGHIIPAIAVAAALEESGVCARQEILFIGSGKDIEKRLIADRGYQLAFVPSRPFLGQGLIGILRFFLSLPGTFFRGWKLISDFAPELILAFGGYPSVVPVLVGRMRGVPVFLQEQNAQVGLANKILSLFAKKIFTVPNASGFLRTHEIVYQPNPVRKEVEAVTPWQAPKPGEAFRLLVMGGSQGAVKLNSAVLAALPMLKEMGVEIFHQSGKVDFERVQAAYKELDYPKAEVVEFTDSIVQRYQWAHLVVSRAGAMSVWELSTAGRPAIFIPLKIARSHQSENARHLEQSGGAIIIEQEAGFEATLAAQLKEFISHPSALASRAAVMKKLSECRDEKTGQVMSAAGRIAQAVGAERKGVR